MSFPSFSSLIDVSSFFIGVLINLLLVALICYYFKKKFDNIEIAQSEQAKILHGLIEERMEQKTVEKKSSGLNFFTMDDLERMNNNTVSGSNVEEEVSNDSKQILLTTEEHTENVNEESSVSDSESEVEEESDSESEDEEETKHVEIVEEDAKYEKMTAKELKEIITERGVNVKKYMKKQEMIDMLTEMDNKGQEVHVVKEEVVGEHDVIIEPVDGGFDLSLTQPKEVVEVEQQETDEQQETVEDELSLGEVVLETSDPDVELE